ncbi:MAG TPA: hypothetical protein ENK89_04955 [Desulfobulbaceae bacterium]|nr:hypothetical protein [Desulfobulbaceae bacterium]
MQTVSDVFLLEEEQPNMLEILGASAHIMEAGLTQKMFAVETPDLLIRPALKHVGYMDFNRGEEIVRLGYEAALKSLTDYNENNRTGLNTGN